MVEYAPPAVALSGLRKTFDDVVAVDGIDLEIADGEFFSMLGPSGSGKTTVLRLVAGFDDPTEGTVMLGGEDVTRLPPFQREVCTVFQDYALFPSMNVRDNVAYGLRVRGVGRAERRRRSDEALEGVRLDSYGDRRPAQLSGGQRQRVALARALIVRPRVLLLDEPLGALDLKLREQMQMELKDIQRDVGITFVFVTHDQEEALTMSDRVAVFNAGRIEQVGTPAELYERPGTAFVAGFVGTSNLLEGEAADRLFGDTGTRSVRPEKIRVSRDLTAADDPEEQTVTGTVAEVVYAGASTRFIVDLDTGGRLVAVQQNLQSSSTEVAGLRGSKVRLSWQRDHGISIGPTSGRPTLEGHLR